MARLTCSLFVLFYFCFLFAPSHTYFPFPEHAKGGEFWAKFNSISPNHPNHLRSADQIEDDQAFWFDQKLDHFDSTNPTTFPQLYYVNEQFYVEGGPNFVTIGGEGPLGSSGAGRFMGYLAKIFGARLLALEHRFYGQSVPGKDFSVQNLQYLTTRQALADVSNFISFWRQKEMKRQNTQKTQIKFFTFGGSYSGALSAWFRLKYPNDTCGSLSSSGVVNAILNFTGFDEQVREAIGEPCETLLRKTTSAFDQAIANGDGASVKSLFGAEHLIDQDFFYMLADSAAMADQYGNKKALCDALAAIQPNNDTNYILGFANFTNSFWGKEFGSSCFYDTNCLVNDPSRWQPTARAWRWQKCSELAYFQIAPSGLSLRSKSVTLAYHMSQCAAIFGPSVTPKTEQTNQYYGGDAINGSRIFFSDFSDDPWQRASVTRQLSNEQPFFLVKCDGCGHCMDFAFPSDNENENLKKEREAFTKYLGYWLENC